MVIAGCWDAFVPHCCVSSVPVPVSADSWMRYFRVHWNPGEDGTLWPWLCLCCPQGIGSARTPALSLCLGVALPGLAPLPVPSLWCQPHFLLCFFSGDVRAQEGRTLYRSRLLISSVHISSYFCLSIFLCWPSISSYCLTEHFAVLCVKTAAK